MSSLSKKLKNNKDYIYEYSDLNLLDTRVKILTGKYREIILEFGKSYLTQNSNSAGGEFYFDYTLYYKPKKFEKIKLRGDESFELFLCDLLISIINDRRFDKDSKEKHQQASYINSYTGKIMIDKSFYVNKKIV